eukprot:TRINITY_DN6971_c0_g5_i1.p1 TRINITY_DN6971_c0_g5~~TRINITY_DN6971_c0_g5_i1.p1  ORF type:complete len:500 (+),score=11.63 TRINITY_DN6971_c0_g5_i1:55-1554(+)
MWTTTKQVAIEDAGLDCLNKLGISVVVLYIVLYEMVYRGSHLETVPVSGVNQLHLRHPTANYCKEEVHPGCESNFSSTKSKPYCKDSKLEYEYEKFHCQIWTSHLAETDDGDAVALTTRVRKFNVTRTCIPDSEFNITCEHPTVWTFNLVRELYTMEPEGFWLWIEHSMTSGKENLSSSSTRMDGYWRSCDTKPCHLEKMEEVPAGFGIPPGFAREKQKTSSIFTQVGRSSSNQLSFQSGALAESATSSRLRSNGLARKLHHSSAKIRTRSRRTEKTHASLSSGSTDTVMTGAIHARGDDVFLTHPKKWSEQQVDVIPIQYLLDVVNVTLDDAHKNSSFRQTGMVISINIRYVNTQADPFDFVGLRLLPWTDPLDTKHLWDPEGSTRARYRISARAFDQGYSNQVHSGHTYTGTHFIQQTQNGILISISQSGEMMVWSSSRMAVFVSTAVGLLSLVFNFTRLWAWACRSKMVQNLLIERYVKSADSGRYEQLDRHDDLT